MCYDVGIRGNLMNWIKDFLKGREKRVVVNNEFLIGQVQSQAFLNAVCWVHLSSLFSLMTSQMISPQMLNILQMTQNYLIQLILIN